MMRAAALPLAAAVAAFATPALAQEPPRGVVSVAWEMAVPVYDMREFHKNVSFRGIATDIHYFVHEMISVGGNISIQRFNDTLEDRTFEIDFGAVTGTLYEYTDVWQFRALGRFYPVGRGQFSPYAGVALGYAWLDRTTLITDFAAQDTNSAFALTPELGVLWQLAPTSPANLTASVRYNFTSASFPRADTLSFISWTVGAYFGF
jgi:hypothetical protein